MSVPISNSLLTGNLTGNLNLCGQSMMRTRAISPSLGLPGLDLTDRGDIDSGAIVRSQRQKKFNELGLARNRHHCIYWGGSTVAAFSVV